MKKTFTLTHPKVKTPRLIDAIRHEVKKYIKRERKKTLPEDADYWDFDCRFGADLETSEVVHMSEISDCISKAETMKFESFYLEIMAKPAHRTPKVKEESSPYDKNRISLDQ